MKYLKIVTIDRTKKHPATKELQENKLYDSLWNRLLQIKAATGGTTCGNAACCLRRA
jgi:hypothetical protein